MAAALISIDSLADLLGERHRIIANDWQAAHMNTLMNHLLDRAADILEQVDFTPKALRADLAGQMVSAGRPYSAAELISTLPICAAIPLGWSTTTSAAGAPSGSESAKPPLQSKTAHRATSDRTQTQRSGAHMAAVTGGCSKKSARVVL